MARRRQTYAYTDTDTYKYSHTHQIDAHNTYPYTYKEIQTEVWAGGRNSVLW